MLASQLGAYQASATAFTQQAASGFEQARISNSRETSAFPQTNYSVSTRAAVPASSSSGKTPAKGSNTEGRGKLIDILA